MSRPPSIIAFERLYLGSLVLDVVNTALFWSATREAMLTQLGDQGAPGIASMVPGIMLGAAIATVAVSLLLWWLVARGHSAAGKWLVVVTEAIGAARLVWVLIGLARGTTEPSTGVLLGLVATTLAVAAAAMLFRADARPWFDEDDADEVLP